MNTLTEIFNGLALKLGQAFGISITGPQLLGLLLLALALPIAASLLVVSLVTGATVSVGRNARRWIVKETVPTLFVLAGATWLGFAGWVAYDHLREHHITIAAGSRTAESYALAQALKTVTARDFPRIRITILEIEGAAGNAGLLEKGVVQLAIAPGDLPAGPSARSVAVLPLSTPLALLARDDVDEGVVYSLTQALMQRGQELAASLTAGKAVSQSPAANLPKPEAPAKSNAPVHPGAAEFYDRDKIPFIRRHARLIALVSAGLVLPGLWAWRLSRRSRRKRELYRESDERRLASLAEREPWTFARILLESIGEASQPLTARAVAPGQGLGRYFRRLRHR